MSGTVYYVVAIKCTKDNSYYLCVSNRETANTIKYFIDVNRTNKTKYVKFNEKVKEFGRGSMICSRLLTKYSDKESAEWFVYNKLQTLNEQGKMLNDNIINPTRIECDGCGKLIRQELLAAHKEKYCMVVAFSDLM